MQKLLIIGYTWPEPKTTGAGVRMMQLIDLFLKNDFQITFASAAEKSNYSVDFKPLGIQEKPIKLNDSSFDEFLKSLSPDIVLFDRFYTEEQFGWRVAEVCPGAIRIIDTEDLHFLRNARQHSLKNQNELNFLDSDIAKRELASIYRCDLSLIISEVEMKLLQNEFKIDTSLLHYIPFLFNKQAVSAKGLPTYEKRKNFIFIGNYKHAPNVDAVLELKKTIWPLISKQLPEAEMHCYGAYADQQISQLHNSKERFFISGWAEDAENVIGNSRVMLAPIRFGAGLKRKLLEAMQYGTPSVTTKIGSEGISSGILWNGFIEEESTNFANKAVQLYSDKSSWQEAQKNGFEILNTKFESSSFESGFLEKIRFIQKRLTKHRNSNFVGSVLMHHSLQSTKYLSKWIEEKNKTKK
ncbi:MAG: glycosyltransferase family 4 protein [Flavobacteriaceae bacterium]